MSTKKTASSHEGPIGDASHYAGQWVMVERETVRTEELNGFCLEVNQSGMLVQYKHRGNVVTDFVPWPHIKRVRHVESEKTKHRA